MKEGQLADLLGSILCAMFAALCGYGAWQSFRNGEVRFDKYIPDQIVTKNDSPVVFWIGFGVKVGVMILSLWVAFVFYIKWLNA